MLLFHIFLFVVNEKNLPAVVSMANQGKSTPCKSGDFMIFCVEITPEFLNDILNKYTQIPATFQTFIVKVLFWNR